MARGFVTMIIIAATLLQFDSVCGAADRHNVVSATEVPGSRIGHHLRGNMDSESEQAQAASSPLPPHIGNLHSGDRRLAARMRFEADSVEVNDYSPPCANKKHDPSVCQPN